MATRWGGRKNHNMSVFNGIADVVEFARGKKDYTPFVEGRGINKSSYPKVIKELLAPSIKTLADKYERNLNGAEQLRTELEQLKTDAERDRTDLEQSKKENKQLKRDLEQSKKENEQRKATDKEQKEKVEQQSKELERLRKLEKRFAGQPELYKLFANPNAKSGLLLAFSLFEAVCTFSILEHRHIALAVSMSVCILFALITFTASSNIFGKVAAIIYAFIVGGVTMGIVGHKTGELAVALTIPTMTFLLAFDGWVMEWQDVLKQKYFTNKIK